ncbi:Asp-tRNA(Asn)/Glu-tRNA(Gln) amidotransferase subunit GatB [Patescibacteria group bacterium]|nr:Asp-tRNA(Asn)/Glu-tRNA(Gln) amidotransferase subunit GatB [Patescibacteria group bacterium]MCG2701579.1 Asp-tRNA(Asn)/Glu-tRNA(Gln) amidotransferase subunit GatB [Candidatus Parcubacteria bacterium]MBU4264453.1 Asp-tRNA(Asn)/Glu-tRNA(Gln) amidotransferase subunit GatB [Patescibacteria group bacterium]MBU4390384.1 Asp-tRNA(Asn)/Glu-tRNA(Gln) amidotransferase subunit GatB [Patescibacteria group bacterium]MBU4397060.1 Asp-tRNA(Asn)/Glu-tRNA(Gln) amidotransferase subunit GatB [Patescibacteria gr
MKITPIIGLEVHVELKTKSKMFCACSAKHFHIPPNSHTCPVCLGLPGALPVPNKTACLWCLKLGLALNCKVNKHSFFERKNYFYPDLPKGYQISQYQKPFTVNGFIKINGQKIRINRVHMEEDTAKSQHIDGSTLLDFNRSGVPLVEIVSEPDIHSVDLVKSYFQKIQQIVRYLGISNADVEKGEMRCEPTVNLKIEQDAKTFYTPLVEIKNIASFTGVLQALEYEIKRQAEEFKKSRQVKNNANKTTRGWNTDKQSTFLQRQKEGSADYRYFPEPDIPPIEWSDKEIKELKLSLPELPDQKIERYKKDFGLSDYNAIRLCEDLKFASVYEKAIGENPSQSFAKFVANLFLGPLNKRLNETEKQLDPNKIHHNFFSDLFDSVQKSAISSTVAKQLIVESYQTGESPLIIAKQKNLLQVSDTVEIEKLVRQVIKDNPKAVEDYKNNPNTIGFLIGQVMQESCGTANPQLVKQTLEKLLN